MTDVKKDKTSLIPDRAAARANYAPAPEAMTGRMGVEVEMALYRIDGGAVRIPTVAAMAELQTDLRDKGYDAQLEAAGVLEYASPAADVADVGKLLSKISAGLGDFNAAANAAGLTVAPYSVLPTTTRDEALKNMAKRERLVVSIAAMQKIFPKPTVEIPLLTAGIQTSFSPRDADEMFAMTRRAYLLTPLLIALSNSSAGFVQNTPRRIEKNYRMRLYDGYGAAGGISPAFLKAVDGQSFIDGHIDAVFKAPMHFAYNPEGGIVAATPDEALTFEGLIKRGWNTQSNYELAESFLYNDIKVCNLRDARGNVMGKRIEVRAADAGQAENVSRAVLLTAAVVPDGAAAEEFEKLCAAFGFTGTPAEMVELLAFSRNSAIDHGGNFMDVPFGTGRMRDFALWLAGIVDKAYAQNAAVDPLLVKDLTDTLRKAMCPAAITAKHAPTLGQITQQMKADAAARPSPAAGIRSAGPRP